MTPYEVLIRRLLPARDLAKPGFMGVVLVCGGRDYCNERRVYLVLDMILGEWCDQHDRRAFAVVHGGARGADRLAGAWARARGIREIACEADWDTHGKAAGYIRNAQMLDEYEPRLVVAFKGGRGTAHMVRLARAAGVEIEEFE